MNLAIDQDTCIRLWDTSQSDIPKDHPYISSNQAYYKELKISQILWQYASEIFNEYGYKIELRYLGKIDNPWNVRWHIIRDDKDVEHVEHVEHVEFSTATEAFEYLESVIKE